ncbi:MAG: hypothetical protein LC650_01895, partial [Actinobacteria bacterium]|nr:hypothetical protein [Actinomycetota bacterium]
MNSTRLPQSAWVHNNPKDAPMKRYAITDAERLDEIASDLSRGLVLAMDTSELLAEVRRLRSELEAIASLEVPDVDAPLHARR